MHRSLIALVAGIVAISVTVGAVTASAARTASPSFALTSEGLGWWWDGETSYVTEGEFTASGAFCPAGSIRTLPWGPQGVVQVLTCADGSGTATVRVGESDWRLVGSTSEWRIVGGTGRYEKLRGQGTFSSVLTDDRDRVCDEFLGCADVGIVRTSWTGVADLDDVPPGLRVVSARASKLGQPAGAYSLELALELRDEAQGPPVPYILRVTTGLRTVAWVSGTAETAYLELAVPIRPGKRALSVRMHLTATDSLGNESSLSSPMVVLPR